MKKMILLFFAVAFGISFYMIGNSLSETYKQGLIKAITMDVINESESATNLKEINLDTVGYLMIKDIDLFYPIVQRDNTFYLYHDYYGGKSKYGTPFLDMRCTVNSKNLIIYSHHMKDGSMFAKLEKYKDGSSTDVEILLNIFNEKRLYVIAGCFQFDSLDSNYHQLYSLDLSQDPEFPEAIWINYEGLSDDMLILSTCDYEITEGRLVILAFRKEMSGDGS